MSAQGFPVNLVLLGSGRFNVLLECHAVFGWKLSNQVTVWRVNASEVLVETFAHLRKNKKTEGGS